MKRLLNHVDVKGLRTSYLLRWNGYSPFADIWEPRSQLMLDVLGLIDQYDKAHPVEEGPHEIERPARFF